MSIPTQFPAGLFLTLEGLEGCGKTTQSHLLKAYFENLGHEVVLVGEPGGTPYGRAARELFLANHRILTPEAEVGLLLTAKSQLLQTVIIPALAAGKVVICDRYTDTLYAYQRWAKGHDPKMMNRLVEAFNCAFDPDFTLLYYIEPETSVKRSMARRDAGGEYSDIDAETLDFHYRLSCGFAKQLNEKLVGTYSVIRGEQTVEEVFRTTCSVLEHDLNDFHSLRQPFEVPAEAA